jgi:hypothetical protein
MARKLFGPGARGALVSEIQAALRFSGFDPLARDGIFGNEMAEAVSHYQRAAGLPASGFIDEHTWSALMKRPVPTTADRCLQLTSAFDGSDYTLAKGNLDGAWLTWGILGFTMKHGEVQNLVLGIYRRNPALLEEAFGMRTADLLRICQADPLTQKAWANANTLPGGLLAQPWRSAFARCGAFPEVQAAQDAYAREHYFKPAMKTAKTWGLTSELGLALCCDIQVQNGGLSEEAAHTVRSQMRLIKPQTERGLREMIAAAVAERAREPLRAEVLARKLTIARGFGNFHGQDYLLENWGLADIQAHSIAA